jgi:hypothetical protein
VAPHHVHVHVHVELKVSSGFGFSAYFHEQDLYAFLVSSCVLAELGDVYRQLYAAPLVDCLKFLTIGMEG